MKEFKVEEVMNTIRKEIKEKGACTDELSYITTYHNKLIKQLKTKKELVIFGAGMYGKSILDDLEQHGIMTIKCFCDNNTKSIGKKIGDYEVLAPQEAWKKYPEACFIITPKLFKNEILIQLIQMGISIDNILTFNVQLAGMEG